MTKFSLADSVNPAKPLLDTVRVPWQVVVHHQVSAPMQVDALAGGVSRDEDQNFGILLERLLKLSAPVTRSLTVDRDNVVRIPQQRRKFVVEIIKGVAMFGEDHELAPIAVGIEHFRVLKDRLGKLFPLRVVAGAFEFCRLGFECAQGSDFFSSSAIVRAAVAWSTICSSAVFQFLFGCVLKVVNVLFLQVWTLAESV